MDLQQDIARRLKKNSKAGMPPGGGVGRVLTKASADDNDADWMVPAGSVPAGGVADQVLTKLSYAEGAYDWRDPPSAGSGFPVAAENFIDAPPVIGSGVSIAGGSNAHMPWIPYDTGFAANATLLTPGTFGGQVGAEVIADGYTTFDMAVGAVSGVDVIALVAVQLLRPGGSIFLALANNSFRAAAADSLGVGCALSLSYPCLAGDVIEVHVATDPASGTTDYGLVANVKQFSA